MREPRTCDACLRRTWLIAALADHIEHSHERRAGLPELLALSDDEMLAALAGARRSELVARRRAFAPARALEEVRSAGLQAVCRHRHSYPPALAPLLDAPAMLHVAGGVDRVAHICAGECVAIVGARRASPYGLEVARALGRGLGAAGVTVVSGMALGVDAAAHHGALEGGGKTIAVLAGGADRPYPATKGALYSRIVATGAVVSEMPPGFRARRWCFPARNRTIAGLAHLTIVVEAAEGSGSLITADFARQLGRDVGAVPGHVTASRARGTNALLFDGAHLVRDTQDVLDLLFGAGARSADLAPGRPELPRHLRELMEAVGNGQRSVAELIRCGVGVETAMDGLAQLELLGYVRRAAGGAYVPVA